MTTSGSGDTRRMALVVGLAAAMAVALVAGLLAMTGPAGAGTFPGTNGRLLLQGDFPGGGPYGYDLYSVGAGGQTPTLIRDGKPGDGIVLGASWSPDGRTIALSDNPPGKNFFALYTVPAIGGTPTRLTPDKNEDGVIDSGDGADPTYSPDGSKIAYVANDTQPDGRGQEKIYTIPAAGGTPTRIAVGTPARNSFSGLQWSPNGARIAFTAFAGDNMHIYTVPASGGAIKKITNLPAGPGYRYVDSPSWSPDGTKIAFYRYGYYDPPPGVPPNAQTDQIYTVPASGGPGTQVTEITPGSFREALWPVWSPDGRRIAFVGYANSSANSRSDVFTTSTTGRSPVRVPNTQGALILEDWLAR